jgi:hypothetical protein
MRVQESSVAFSFHILPYFLLERVRGSGASCSTARNSNRSIAEGHALPEGIKGGEHTLCHVAQVHGLKKQGKGRSICLFQQKSERKVKD